MSTLSGPQVLKRQRKNTLRLFYVFVVLAAGTFTVAVNSKQAAQQALLYALGIVLAPSRSAEPRAPRSEVSVLSPTRPGKLAFSRSVSARKSLIATEAIRCGHRKFTPSQKSASFAWWLSRI